MPAKYDAQTLADMLGEQHVLTEQQKAIIEAPLDAALVIAGAGSGKTETMSHRVVYLVANGFVAPHEILGMTFTRKAAGELRQRIRNKLSALNRALGGALELDVFDQVTVSTYNSFASQLFSQYAVLIGRNPEATVLGDAAAWQLARTVAKQVPVSLMVDIDKSLDQLTQAIMDFSRAIADNIANPEKVAAFGAKMAAHLAPMPVDDPHRKGRKRTAINAEWQRALTVARSIEPLTQMSQLYAQLKRDRNFVEFSDQVALAYDICQRFDHVVTDIRNQYKVVLLDEYQDTSVVQNKLLATLFKDHSVMAVGDPHQSIYGWRGASSDNMAQFETQFSSHPKNVQTYSLLTSWRNPKLVLDGANQIVEPLASDSLIRVEKLRASDKAADGDIDVVFAETIYDEAKAVASWFSTHLTAETDAAMLCRNTRTIAPFTQALGDARIPFHVVGIGGLLDQPGVVDVICGMRVLHNATSDSELVRLLTGTRWRLGLSDIRALKRLADWISKHDYRQQWLDKKVIDAMKASVVNEDTTSLVDALDFIVRAKPDHKALQEFSHEGMARLREAAELFAELRQHVGTDVREIITMVSQALLVDIEIIANDDNAVMNANLEAFQDLVTPYLVVDDRPTLGGFLSWLGEAERRERLTPQSVEPEKGVVQVMTIHGAKGLEWDLVAVPRMVENELPSDPSNANHWVTFGALPNEFRGDSIHLPVLNWRGAQTQTEFEQKYKEFRERVKEQQLAEDRRLAYVAVTRTKTALLLSGSFWATQQKPRNPSIFTQDLLAGIGRPPLAGTPANDTNPVDTHIETMVWPVDPLGLRREKVERAAEMVREANLASPTPWDDDIELLLAERNRRLSGELQVVALPTRIAASKFKDFIDDPEKMARQLRRPVPEQPYRATNLGTIFHSWVEQRSQSTHLVELLDAHPNEFDVDDAFSLPGAVSDAYEYKLTELKKTFEASEWGSRKPLAVELEINLPFGSQSIVCKIDAIYEVPGQPDRVEIVDWKTGKAPHDEHDEELKQIQLALYRLAYSKWAQIEPDLIDVAFYFVADDKVIRPEKVYSEAELREAWSSVTGSKP